MRILGKRGFTLVELVITLVIVAILTVISTATMLGYIPKSRLSNTARDIELTLQRAQSEAQAKGLLTGVHFYQLDATNGPCYYQLCYDDTPSTAPDMRINVSGGVGTKDSCRKEQVCGSNIVFLTGSNCGGDTSVITPNNSASTTTDGSVIYFKPDGQAYAYSGSSLDPKSFQIFIRSLDLPAAANEKEIEVLETGLINLPKVGQAGYQTLIADQSCGSN